MTMNEYGSPRRESHVRLYRESLVAHFSCVHGTNYITRGSDRASVQSD